MGSPEDLYMVSRATSEPQLIRHIESCNRLGVAVEEVLRVPKDKIPEGTNSDFLAFTRVSAPKEKLEELIAYIKALEDIADLWNLG